MTRASKGDKTCTRELVALLADGDRGEAVLRYAGSSAEWLRQAVARKAAGKNVLVSQAVHKKLGTVQAELEGPTPTAIERLLAERASLCWFVANWYEEQFVIADSLSVSQADYFQRRIDRAHRRFLSAVETLARVRKMALPSLMVNIAKNQQVNMVPTRKPGQTPRSLEFSSGGDVVCLECVGVCVGPIDWCRVTH
jgi:hypothetical protein